MVRLVISRLLWFIPTIIAILALTFCLVKLVPGDPIESYLDGEVPVGPSALEMYDLYNDAAAELNMHLPSFYFSLTPFRYHRSFYELPYLEQQLVNAMLKEGYGWSQCELALESLHEMMEQKGQDQDLQLEIRNAIKSADVDVLVERFPSLASWEVSEKVAKGSLYVPKFKWHGMQNQFQLWFQDLFNLQLGISKFDGQPVVTKLLDAIRWTITINFTSILIAYLLAIPIGVYSGWYVGSYFDKAVNLFLTILYAIPVFWMASLLVVFFSTPEFGSWTNIFPPVGIWRSRMGDTFGQLIQQNAGQFMIPILTLSSAMLAYITRQIRGSIATERNASYVFHARAKGLSESRIIWNHAFRNASFPLITMLASVLPASIGGSLVVEIICNIPGMGRLLFDSIFQQDWPVVIGVVTITAIFTVLGLFMADLLYSAADPRLKTAVT